MAPFPITAYLPSMTCFSLIDEADKPPVEFCHVQSTAPVILTCDHASRSVPRALDNLGLDDAAILRHIAWDIGAADVTRRLAPLLDAPAILCGYSRLVIDCNRDPVDPSSIPAVSDGTVIPGNTGLSLGARRLRRTAIFDPYHDAIASRIASHRHSGVAPALISIHSFTPVMQGVARPWHIGVLWDRDGRIALPLLEGLRAEAGLVVGDNEPYSAREPVGFTQRHHAFGAGLPHVAIELRQDLVGDAAGAARWAERLARLLRPILDAPTLYVAIPPGPPHS